jgi:hypothetical protein
MPFALLPLYVHIPLCSMYAFAVHTHCTCRPLVLHHIWHSIGVGVLVCTSRQPPWLCLTTVCAVLLCRTLHSFELVPLQFESVVGILHSAYQQGLYQPTTCQQVVGAWLSVSNVWSVAGQTCIKTDLEKLRLSA